MNGVSAEVLAQLSLFGRACLLGAAMTAVYDGIRIFRRIWRHGIAGISIEDSLYWIAFAVTEFVMLYRENNGVLRAYVFWGTAVGAILYHFLISRYLMKAASGMIIFVKKQLKKAYHAVTIWITKKYKSR